MRPKIDPISEPFVSHYEFSFWITPILIKKSILGKIPKEIKRQLIPKWISCLIFSK